VSIIPFQAGLNQQFHEFGQGIHGAMRFLLIPDELASQGAKPFTTCRVSAFLQILNFYAAPSGVARDFFSANPQVLEDLALGANRMKPFRVCVGYFLGLRMVLVRQA
jgi:hypothetical protein